MFWEKYYPWLFALATILAMGLVDILSEWDAGFPAQDTAKFLLASSVSSSAIFTAFLTTTLSLLMGLDTPAARRVFETEFGNLLLAYFKEGIVGSLVFCLVSLSGYYWQDATPYFYVWVFSGVFAICAFWRCVNLLFLLVRKNETKY